jgi:hypothetical protein
MHNKPVNQSDPAQAAINELDERLIRALETAPTLQIPADFAARVATQLPAQRPISLPSTHYGLYATIAGMVVIFIALLALSGRVTDHSVFGLTLQWTLCAQFIAIAVWLSVRRHDLS